MRTICLICMLCLAVVVKAASPIQGLLERIDKGASRKFVNGNHDFQCLYS